METLTLTFQLKKSKLNASGKAPINLRVTINSKRLEVSTRLYIEPSKWDMNRQNIKGRSEEAQTINNYLQNFKSKVQREYNLLSEKDDQVKITELKAVLGGKRKRSKSLLEVFEENNQLMENEKGTNYTANTVERYKISITRLTNFLKQDIAGIEIMLDELDYKFIKRYDNYLRTNYDCGHNTVMKYLKHLKKVIHQAMSFGYINHDPFLGYKTAYKETNRGYLTQTEVNSIKAKTFRLKRLEETRDIFLFVCYTGISYSDLKNLSYDNIQTGIDGKKMIVLERKKTRVRAVIPILSETQTILDKYIYHPICSTDNKLLPVISNQKANAYLLEIAELCEIAKTITMHLGRHTFATTIALTNGVPLETVQKMLGHKNIQTTQIYSKVIDSKVSEDMEKLEERIGKTG